MKRRQTKTDRKRKDRLRHQRHRAQALEVKSPRKTAQVETLRPFCGVDGEGAGLDHLGRQNYMLLQAGDHRLHTSKPLQTAECLEFLLSLPPSFIYVGFAFSYDVTMILRDLPPDRIERLMGKPIKPENPENLTETPASENLQRSPWVWWKGFALQYLPRNYFRVARLQRDLLGRERIVKGTSRTVYDVFGNFQGSFLKALKSYGIGRDHWSFIERNKANRAQFLNIGPEEQEYCRRECHLLADLMETFRRHAHDAGIFPREWSGAGKSATSLHERMGTPKRQEVRLSLDPELRDLADAAYYGGRFEISVTGRLEGGHEHDINSAYPANMLHLPCIRHGRWFPASGATLDGLPPGTLYLARVHFQHPPSNLWCGFPIRKKDGRLYWPIEGNGVYWSCEIDSARQLGAVIRHRRGWVYEAHCSCDPLGDVRETYRHRLRLKQADDGSDIPLKLAINSLYGKLAQRIGSAPYQNPLWAGLVTARTRAQLNEVIAQDPAAVVMVATDAVYTTHQMAVPIGADLGQWGHNAYAGIHIVQPGVYWCEHGAGWQHYKRKTRGFGLSVLDKHADDFKTAWRLWLDRGQLSGQAPTVAVRMRQFIGLKLAMHRGKPDLAGTWINEDHPKAVRQVSYGWTDKRSWRADPFGADAVRHYPHSGGAGVHSHIYTPSGRLEAGELWDEDRIMLDDQPDFAEYLPSSAE